jgi:hypothetical protein
MIPNGSGDGTRRRQPRPASSPLRNDRHYVFFQILQQEFILQGLCDLESDGALRVCYAISQRNLVERVFCEFGA